MGSSPAAGGLPGAGDLPGTGPLPAGGILADPYLWGLLLALFLGVGLALLGRSILTRYGTSRHRHRRAGRAALSAWGILFLAFSLGSATGLLILPPKSSLQGALFFGSCAGAFLLGLGSGLWPRAFGIPCLLAVLGLGVFFSRMTEGWLPLRGPGAVARLTPFSAEKGLVAGELEVTERDGLPLAQHLEFRTAAAGLTVEFLSVKGPIGLLAGRSFYRVAGLVGQDGADAELRSLADFRLSAPFLDSLIPLPSGEGARVSRFSLERWRVSSEPRVLVPLEPLRFSLAIGPEGLPRLAVESAEYLGK